MPTDQELMRAVKEGDPDAFAALVTRHRARAEGYARRILGDGTLAEDTVQDCFVKVYLLRAEYREGFSFQAYLYALIRNRCIDLLRQRRRRDQLLPDAIAGQAADDTPEAAYLRSEYRLRLWSAMERLSEQERGLLLGYAYEHKPYRDIARERHMSVAQVKIKLHRIRKKLKTAREDDDDGLY